MYIVLFRFFFCADLFAHDQGTPTVTAVCVHGDMDEALLHLNTRTICIYSPEEVRGGGFMKYCRLLTKGYKVRGCEHPLRDI